MKNSYFFRYNLDDFLIVFEDFLKTVLQFLKALIQPISIILEIKQREKAYFPKKLSYNEEFLKNQIVNMKKNIFFSGPVWELCLQTFFAFSVFSFLTP